MVFINTIDFIRIFAVAGIVIRVFVCFSVVGVG
jgi:hypothetical protein